MFKKICSIIMVAVMLLSLNITTFAGNSKIGKDDIILQQAIELDRKIDESDENNYSVVVLVEKEDGVRTLSTTDEKKAIQLKQTEGDITKVTTIIPFKLLSNGELVNSFEYAATQNLNTRGTPTTFVDVTVTVDTSYAHYFSMENIENFYRHAGIEVYWSSSNPTVSVSNMLVWYDSAGELYMYPECLTESLESTLVQDYYFIRSTVDQDNPIKDTVYMDGNHTMPLNRVLRCTDYMEHGGLIYLQLTYSANGTNYVHDRSYYVYTK